MHLALKVLIQIEVNEMNDGFVTSMMTWVCIQPVISMQFFKIVSLALLQRVMAMPIFQNKKYNVTISNR